MAILKKAKSALKKVASKVYTTLNPIVKSVSSALTAPISTKGQTASAFDALQQPKKDSFVASQQQPYTGQGQNTSKDLLTYGVGTLVNDLSKKSSSKAGSSNLVNQAVSASNLISGTPYTPPTSFNAGTKITTDTSGESYNPYASTSLSTFTGEPLNQTVSSKNLSSPSISTPSTPGATNYQGTAIGGNVGLGGDATTGMLPTPGVDAGVPVEEAPKEKSAIEDLINSLKPPAELSKSREKALRESGLQEAQQQRANTQNQINAITAKMNTDLLQLRGTAQKEGVVEAVYGGQQAQITREATIRLLPLQAQLSADQENLSMAQERMDTLFDIYSKDAQRSVDAYNDQKKMVYEYATTQEKRRLDEQLYQKNYIKSQIDNISSIVKETMMQFLKDKNQAGFEALKKIQPPSNMNSPTIERDFQRFNQDVNNALARYGVQTKQTQQAQQYSDPFINKLANSAGGKPLTDTFAQKLDKGLTVLGQIGSLQTNIKNIKTGPIVGAFKGANPWDTNAQTIKSQLNAIVPNLARGVYGEVGVLTDNDIAQYSKTLPNLKSTEDIRNAVLGITVDLISKSIKRTLEVNAANGKDVSGFIDLYTEMGQTRDSIFSQIPGYKSNTNQQGGNIVTAPDGTLVEIID